MESPICNSESDRFWTAVLCIMLFLVVCATALCVLFAVVTYVGFGPPLNASIAALAGLALCVAVWRAIP